MKTVSKMQYFVVLVLSVKSRRDKSKVNHSQSLGEHCCNLIYQIKNTLIRYLKSGLTGLSKGVLGNWNKKKLKPSKVVNFNWANLNTKTLQMMFTLYSHEVITHDYSLHKLIKRRRNENLHKISGTLIALSNSLLMVLSDAPDATTWKDRPYSFDVISTTSFHDFQQAIFAF